MDIKIDGFSIENTEYYQSTLNIRNKVFVQELGYDKHLEFDSFDTKAMHYIIFYDVLPVGCARWVEEDGELLIDRFCILPKFRRRGLAIVMIKFIISELIPSKKKINLLSSDDTYIFFTQVGFKDTSNTRDIGNKQLRIINFQY